MIYGIKNMSYGKKNLPHDTKKYVCLPYDRITGEFGPQCIINKFSIYIKYELCQHEIIFVAKKERNYCTSTSID